MKTFLLILATMAITGCAQLTGPTKAQYDTKTCETHFIFDDELKANRITHETCSFANVKSTRVYPNGILIEGNKQTGAYKIDTTSIQNAEESSLVKALSQLLATPSVLEAIINATKEKP